MLVVLDHVLQRGRPVDAPLELGRVQHSDLMLQLLDQGRDSQEKRLLERFLEKLLEMEF